MALATLSIDIEARLAGLQEGFDKAARLAQKNAAETEAAWNRLGSTAARLGGLLAGAFAGASIVEFVRRNIDAVDALNDVADATGASIENISALEDLAKRTGTTLDVVSSSLVRLNKELSDTDPNSDASRALQAIGLSAADLRKQDPAEALRLVAVALSGYTNDANKARLIQELFGKSVAEVAPFLNDLAEKSQLVATTTAAQAAEAEKFNKQLFEMQANSDLARRAFVTGLLPALNQLLTEFRTGIEVFGGFKEALLSIGTSNPFTNIGDRVEQLAKLREELAKVNEEASGAKTRTDQLRTAQRRKELEAEIDTASKLIEYYRRVQTLTAPQASYSNEGRVKVDAPPSINFDTKKPATAKKEEISEAQRALASYVGELEKELEKVEQLSEQQKALNVLKSLGSMGEVPQVRELVLGLERQVTLAKQDNAIRADNLRIAKEQEAIERDLSETIYKLSGRADEARKIALTSKLEEQLNSGVEYSSAELERIVKGIAGITDDTKDKLNELDELTKQFARNVQDALGDTLLATIRGDYDSILSLWGNLLLRMASEAAAAELGKALFGSLFAKTGDGAGQLGGLFGSLFDSVVNSMPFALAAGGVVDEGGIQRFASGGVFDRATRFSYGGGRHLGELGEAGPEAILPLRRGPDGRLGVASSGQVGPTVVFQIASGVTRGELASMVPQLTARVKAELQMSARRPGGGA